MIRTLTLALAILSSGCSMFGIEDMPPEARKPTQAERKAAHRTMLRFDAHPELTAVTPQDQSCLRKVSDFRIAKVDEQRFRDLCHRCGPHDPDPDCERWGRAWACLREQCWGKHSVRKRCYETPVLVQHEALPAPPIVHEFGHVLAGCAPGYDGPKYDRYHEDERIWCTDVAGPLGPTYCGDADKVDAPLCAEVEP